jgi:hypothetical protein
MGPTRSRGTVVSERLNNERVETGGDAFSTAFEMIVTPAIFGLLGWLIDSRLDLFPVFTLVLTGLVFVYEVWKVYVQYSADMDAALEARRTTYGQPPSQGGAAS